MPQRRWLLQSSFKIRTPEEFSREPDFYLLASAVDGRSDILALMLLSGINFEI